MKRVVAWTLLVLTATPLMTPPAAGCRPEVPGTETRGGDAAGSRFHWKGTIARGGVIEIKGLNGDVRAVPASGPETEVSATKRGRRSKPDDVQIKVLEHAGGVTICAVYPSDDASRPNLCESGEAAPMSVNNNDVEVDFEVRVPASVRFVGRTVNGGVEAKSLAGDAEGHSKQGNVVISTSGLARASTSNGSINVTFKSASWADTLVFETSNGNITLGLPADLNAKVEAQTQTGNITSAFPLPAVPTAQPAKSLEGTVGTGANRLVVKTNSGNIELNRVK